MHDDFEEEPPLPTTVSNPEQDFAPLTEPQLSNPYPFFAQARRQSPIFFTPLRTMAVITKYDDVQAILKRGQLFPLPLPPKDTAMSQYAPEVQRLLKMSILGTSPGFAFSNPVEHPRFRKALTKILAPRQIIHFESQMRETAAQLIEQFVQNDSHDFIRQFAHLYPLFILCHLVGIPEEDREQVRTWIEDWINLLFMRIPPEMHVTHVHSLLSLEQYLSQLLEQRLVSPQQDLATGLLHALHDEQANQPILDAIELLIVLFVAGFEITENFLGLCLLHILSQRAYWETIHEDANLLALYIEEMLRFDSSGVGLFRQTAQEVKVGDVALPAGLLLHLSLGSANHDEAYFSSSEVFTPHRNNFNHHIAFGYGVHYCVGAPIARLEIRIALELLRRRVPTLRLMPHKQIEYKQHSTSLRGLKHLFIEWDK